MKEINKERQKGLCLCFMDVDEKGQWDLYTKETNPKPRRCKIPNIVMNGIGIKCKIPNIVGNYAVPCFFWYSTH